MPEIFTFTTPLDTWRFTNAKKLVNFMGNDYPPAPIKRDKWDRGLSQTDLSLTGPADIEPFSLYIGFNPSHPVDIEIRNVLTGDIEFVGTVFSAQFTPKKSLVTFKIRDLFQRLRGDVPSRRFSPGCNWALYDDFCTVDRDLFKVSFPVSEAVISEDMFTIQHPNLSMLGGITPTPASPDNFFTSGFAENSLERVYIVKHEGDTITVISNFVRLAGITIEVFAGCNKLRNTCKDKFDNEVNFGGWPFVPGRNPVTDGF